MQSEKAHLVASTRNTKKNRLFPTQTHLHERIRRFQKLNNKNNVLVACKGIGVRLASDPISLSWRTNGEMSSAFWGKMILNRRFESAVNPVLEWRGREILLFSQHLEFRKFASYSLFSDSYLKVCAGKTRERPTQRRDGISQGMWSRRRRTRGAVGGRREVEVGGGVDEGGRAGWGCFIFPVRT